MESVSNNSTGRGQNFEMGDFVINVNLKMNEVDYARGPPAQRAILLIYIIQSVLTNCINASELLQYTEKLRRFLRSKCFILFGDCSECCNEPQGLFLECLPSIIQRPKPPYRAFGVL